MSRHRRPSRLQSLAVSLPGLLVAMIAGVTLVLVPPSGRATAQQAPDAVSTSAVTLPGRIGVFGDDYSGLRVTVSQTRDLTNQGVTVSWTGGKPSTVQSDGAILTNFVQIMQCWGPDPNAADFRETCQVGGSATDVTRRAPNFVDPAETLPAGSQMVPFRSAETGQRTANGSPNDPFPPKPCAVTPCPPGTAGTALAPYFSEYTTNEIYQAVTNGEGNGRTVFEMQTATESSHLGCGRVPAGQTSPPPCWLVVVPRGDHEVSGPTTRVVTSPLSGKVWQDKIAFQLDFRPIGVFCPQGQKERALVGSEFAAEAIASWQPTLCAGNGPVFSFSRLSDADTRRQVLSRSGGAGLGFTIDPVTAAEDQGPVVHAPVVLSSAVIAFNVDARIDDTAPPDVLKLQGSEIRDLKLTPRLVAKLLTQSYQRDVPGGQQGAVAYLKDNPRTLAHDPEFRALNPIFASFPAFAGADGIFVTVGQTAAAREVWRWVLADPDARAWLAGGPDAPGGTMKVNPNYAEFFAGGAAPTSFPKNDPSCYKATPEATEPFCTLDLRPPVDTMRDGAYRTLRADVQSRIVWDTTAVPAAYRATPPTDYGKRFVLSITDAASAARYGLATAQLLNRAGEFVAPTQGTVLAAANALVPGAVPDVKQIDAAKATAGAYPLPMLTYAAVDLSESVDVRKDYATLLRYAAGPGQTSGAERGHLPDGYVPLPEALQAQTRAAATTVENYAPPVPPRTQTTAVTGPQHAPVPPNPVAAVPTTTPTHTPLPTKPPVAVARITDAEPLGNLRYVLVATVGVGLVAAIVGPILLRMGSSRRRRSAQAS